MNHKLFWGSSYDRGISNLLYLWGDIIEKFPDAELHICYGWEGFDRRYADNPERQQWKADTELLMTQRGITHHGKLGKEELAKVRSKCGIWAYPTNFYEIHCITALEAQADGLVPVAVNYGALSETVGSGVLVDHPIEKNIEAYKSELLKLMGDEDRWKSESKKAIEFARKHQNNHSKWITELSQPIFNPKVTIYTPTIRQGFWNIQAHALSKQTYKNFEWLIVDDFKQNRAETAKLYADKYSLDYQYIHAPKRAVKRIYGLSSANNVAYKNAKGELLVFLQDFVLPPENGIEMIVDLYRHHPNDFIAPVDIQVSTIKPDTSSEDWYNGELDIVTEELRRNIRITSQGIRVSQTVTDLELNYGAIPISLLKKLNGFYEIFDDGLGYDDTEIVFRGWQLGAKLIVDDRNRAICIDHWKPLEDNPEQLGKDRHINLNDPRYYYLTKGIKNGSIPVVRDSELDNKLRLEYKIPEGVNPTKYVRGNLDKIIEKW